jgi:hypothetical protein
MMREVQCPECSRKFFTKHVRAKFCSAGCWGQGPAVYRYVSPDGRSYVGSTGDYRTRDRFGIDRVNSRLTEAYAEYPPELWRFEVLEKGLPLPGRELRLAEQNHIERLRSWMPEHGFNMQLAIWSVEP